MRKLWMAFWTLSKVERVGLTALLIILGAHLFWQSTAPEIEGPVFLDAELSSLALRLEQQQATAPTDVPAELPATLFKFNINTADSLELGALGLSEKSISGLLRFRSKGGLVRDMAGFDKLFSLTDRDKARLRDWVQFELPPRDVLPAAGEVARESERTVTWRLVDLNAADSLSLLAVPGVGPATASRILSYRQRLGGFARLEQLREVYSIDSTRFEAIAPFLMVDSQAVLSKLNLNLATEQDLAAHPYFGKTLARRLVAYRSQHGNFESAEALKRIHGLDSMRLTKLLPYCQW